MLDKQAWIDKHGDADASLDAALEALGQSTRQANWLRQALAYYKTGLEQGHGLSDIPEYVPKTIVMRRTVTGMERATVAHTGAEFEARCNAYGAVSVVAENGKLLGVKPHEFNVLQWARNPHYVEEEVHA